MNFIFFVAVLISTISGMTTGMFRKTVTGNEIARPNMKQSYPDQK